jgi:hypothetical protein
MMERRWHSMEKMTFKAELTLDREELIDILTTAMEGGIGYWRCLDNTCKTWKKAKAQVKAEKGNDYYLEDVMLQVLENGDDIVFIDAEEDPDDPEAEVYKFNMKGFKNGLALFTKERGNPQKMLAEGSFDAVEADCLIQYACFGEIVFG